MSITIHPAELQDASGMLDVSMAAFAGDVLSEATFGLSSASEEEVADFRNWRTDLTKLRMNGRGKHYFKAVDSSTGSVVGFIGVYGPDAEAPAQSSVSLPTHMNHEVDDEVKTKMKAANDRLVGDRKDVWCESPSLGQACQVIAKAVEQMYNQWPYTPIIKVGVLQEGWLNEPSRAQTRPSRMYIWRQRQQDRRSTGDVAS